MEINQNTLVNQWIKEEINTESKNILRQVKMDAQHTKTYGMHTAKTVLRLKLVAMNTYIKKIRSEIDSVILHLKEIEKEHTKPNLNTKE